MEILDSMGAVMQANMKVAAAHVTTAASLARVTIHRGMYTLAMFSLAASAINIAGYCPSLLQCAV